MSRRRRPKFNELRDEYKRLVKTMKINPSWTNGLMRIVKRVEAGRSRYEEVSRLTGGKIPWYFIGVIHSLEAANNFNKHLHNGDSLSKRTRRVPAGRPLKGNPPFTFEESAVDALKQKGFEKVDDWSIEHMCFMLERYNGWGYRMFHPTVLSPYLWSGTNHYTRGKYYADGKFSYKVKSAQGGAVPILVMLMQRDKKAPSPIPMQEVSRKENFLVWLQRTLFGGGLTLTALWNGLQEVRTFVQDNAGLILLGVGAATFLVSMYIKYKNNQDFQEGRYIPSGLVNTEEEEDGPA